MNFNYSYRAFLITCLLFGILFLAFESIKLSKYVVVKEDNFGVEYSENDIFPEEDLATVSLRDVKIETNRAYNEAEKFISEVESEREETTENSDGKQEIEYASNENATSSNSEANIAADKKITKEKGQILSKGSEKKQTVSVKNSSKKNSTVSYRLVNRTALDLPNPVYTCEAYGKVVVIIEVRETGKVFKAIYNSVYSTTSNGCLIDKALDYAKQARFTTVSKKHKQLGTITYNFPGQQ